jgi:hypothetical protein
MLWPSGSMLDAISAFPSVLLAFTFQFNVFPVFFTLKERTNSSMMKASSMGIFFCLTLYICTGIMGFFMYGHGINDTILPILGEDGRIAYTEGKYFIVFLMVLINVGFTISSTMSLPLMFFSLKKNLLNTVVFCEKKFGRAKKTGDVSGQSENLLHTVIADGQYTDSEQRGTAPSSAVIGKKPVISDLTKNIITLVLYILICLITILVDKLTMVKLLKLLKLFNFI